MPDTACIADAARPDGPAPALPSVDWWITSRCNLSCDYCYGPVPARDPAERRAAIARAIGDSSAAAVTFCGGEPLTVRDLDRHARALAARGKVTVLNTNGLLLRRRLARGLDFPFAVVGLSVDGSVSAVHEAMRGARADLGEVLAVARLLAADPGVSLKLATVVSAVNRGDLPRLAGLVREIGPDVWRLYQYSARGPQNTGQARHALPAAEFASLAGTAARLAAPVPVAASPEDLTAGCLIVSPAGDVLLPSATGYAVLGSCLDEPVDQIWARVTAPGPVLRNKRWLGELAGLAGLAGGGTRLGSPG